MSTKKFRVTRTRSLERIVEAKNEEDAIKIASKIWGDKRDHEWRGEPAKFEAEQVEG